MTYFDLKGIIEAGSTKIVADHFHQRARTGN
jgi:hypothetical protein